jgi:hypothetical protein
MKLYYGLMQLLFPDKCILCGKLLTRDELDLCRDCRTDSPEYPGRKETLQFLDSFTAVWYYEGNVRRSLLRYKFYNCRSFAEGYGRILTMKLLREYPGNDPYRQFYDALLDLGDGSTLEARRKLETLQTIPPEIKAQYFYFLGEACLRTGAGKNAARAYRQLLQMTRTPEQKKVIESKIRAAESMQ